MVMILTEFSCERTILCSRGSGSFDCGVLLTSFSPSFILLFAGFLSASLTKPLHVGVPLVCWVFLPTLLTTLIFFLSLKCTCVNPSTNSSLRTPAYTPSTSALALFIIFTPTHGLPHLFTHCQNEYTSSPVIALIASNGTDSFLSALTNRRACSCVLRG